MVTKDEQEQDEYPAEENGEDEEEGTVGLERAEDLEEGVSAELPGGFDLEPGIEAVPGEEGTDDPIRMYLHEICLLYTSPSPRD